MCQGTSADACMDAADPLICVHPHLPMPCLPLAGQVVPQAPNPGSLLELQGQVPVPRPVYT